MGARASDWVVWVCSFDVLRDDLGRPRTHFPHTIYGVTGSQAATAKSNVITLFKLADIAGKKPSQDDSSSSDDDMSDEEEGQPRLSVRQIAHHGAINRIRSMPQQPSIVASWSEAGHVQVCSTKTIDARKCPRASGKPALGYLRTSKCPTFCASIVCFGMG